MDTTTGISEQLRTDLEEVDKWKLVTPRHPKVKIDKNKNMVKVSECTVQQMLISKNPYAALEVDSDIIRSDVKTIIVFETKINDIDSNQKDNKYIPVRYCTSTVEEPQKKIVTHHNLQNQKTQLKQLAKEDNETYSIPMLIN
jgi:hypothetical protein